MYYKKKVWVRRFERIHQQFMELMMDGKRYADPECTPGKVAEQMGLSAGYLTTVLKAHTGYSLQRLIYILRAREACRLLRSDWAAEWPTEMIGLRCGFASRQAFHRIFRQEMGVTPLQFRKMTDEEARLCCQAFEDGLCFRFSARANS